MATLDLHRSDWLVFPEWKRSSKALSVDEARTKSSWSSAATDWTESELTFEGAFTRTVLPSIWSRSDATVRETLDGLGLVADELVVRTARMKAIEGDERARAICFRASRGFARPVEPSQVDESAEALPPEVADAMMEAGLAALKRREVVGPAPTA